MRLCLPGLSDAQYARCDAEIDGLPRRKARPTAPRTGSWRTSPPDSPHRMSSSPAGVDEVDRTGRIDRGYVVKTSDGIFGGRVETGRASTTRDVGTPGVIAIPGRSTLPRPSRPTGRVDRDRELSRSAHAIVPNPAGPRRRGEAASVAPRSRDHLPIGARRPPGDRRRRPLATRPRAAEPDGLGRGREAVEPDASRRRPRATVRPRIGLAQELAARDRKVAELERAYRAALRDRELATALAGKPLVAGAAAQLIKLWRDDFDVYEEDGEYRVTARDGRAVDQAVAERLAGAEYAHFCLPSSRGGAGAKGPSQSAARPPPPPAARRPWARRSSCSGARQSATRVRRPSQPIGLGPPPLDRRSAAVIRPDVIGAADRGPPRRAPASTTSRRSPPAEFVFMPNAYLQGIQTAFDNQAEIRNDIYVVASNWFVNRCPLVTRIPRVPVGSTTFTIVSRTFRPRIATLAAAVAAADTQIALVDASPFMNGDVLELASGERVEIIGRPEPRDQHRPRPPRRRGDHRRRPAPSNDTIRLIGNSRTGAEINQNGVALQPGRASPSTARPGSTRSRSAARSRRRRRIETSPGVRTPFEQNKMDALQNLMDDMEVSSYYGRGEDPAVVGPARSRRA